MKNITTLPLLDTLVDIEKSKTLATEKAGLFTSLTDKGLNKLTDSEIEHIMCTSSLAAFN